MFYIIDGLTVITSTHTQEHTDAHTNSTFAVESSKSGWSRRSSKPLQEGRGGDVVCCVWYDGVIGPR